MIIVIFILVVLFVLIGIVSLFFYLRYIIDFVRKEKQPKELFREFGYLLLPAGLCIIGLLDETKFLYLGIGVLIYDMFANTVGLFSDDYPSTHMAVFIFMFLILSFYNGKRYISSYDNKMHNYVYCPAIANDSDKKVCTEFEALLHFKFSNCEQCISHHFGDVPCMNCSHTGLQTCEECDGRGMISCETCEGNCTVECPECEGLDDNCPECNGNKEIECPECEGSGSYECDKCYGKGKTECTVCGGEGYIDNLEEYEYDYSDII